MLHDLSGVTPTVSRTLLALAIVLGSACVLEPDDADPVHETYRECGPDHVTTYLSLVAACAPDSVCVEDRGPGGPPMCRRLCADNGCQEGEWWKTELVKRHVPEPDERYGRDHRIRDHRPLVYSICYCEPSPLSPTR